MKTMDVDNALLADDAKDRKKLYRDLQKQIEKTEKRRAKITTAAGAMASEAETLFKNWETSISSPALHHPALASLGAQLAHHDPARTGPHSVIMASSRPRCTHTFRWRAARTRP
jgi:hypothetical protein